jgi:minor capsid protein 2
MADQDLRLPYERRIDELLAAYRQAQRAVAADIRAAILTGDLRAAVRRRAQLAAVMAALDQLGAETDPIARRLVQDAWTESAARTADLIAGLDIVAPEIPGAFTGVSVPALQALEDSILGRLDTARRTVGRQADDVYAKAGRRAAIRSILGADDSPAKAARALARDLRRQRAVGFVDRAGKRWALDTYSEMAVRTVTREAVVQGAIARMASHGINLARVSVHAEACPVCRPWEGRLVSLDGSGRGYQGEAVTDLSSLPNGGPPFHPRCRHSLAPVAVRVEEFRQQRARATA